MRDLSRSSTLITITQLGLVFWLFGSGLFVAVMAVFAGSMGSSISGTTFSNITLVPICAVPFVSTFVMAMLTFRLEKARVNSLITSLLLIAGTLVAQFFFYWLSNFITL